MKSRPDKSAALSTNGAGSVHVSVQRAGADSLKVTSDEQTKLHAAFPPPLRNHEPPPTPTPNPPPPLARSCLLHGVTLNRLKYFCYLSLRVAICTLSLWTLAASQSLRPWLLCDTRLLLRCPWVLSLGLFCFFEVLQMKKKKNGCVKKKVLFSSSNSALTNISLCQKWHYNQARFCSGNGWLVMKGRFFSRVGDNSFARRVQCRDQF